MSSLVLAHAGHWLSSLALAFAPLTVIGGMIAVAIRERRDRRSRDLH